jgi:hypothetical protein
MSKHQRLLLKILRGGSDANIPFEDLWLLSREMARTQRSIR